MNFPLKHMTVDRRGGYLNRSGVQSRRVIRMSHQHCAAWVLVVEAFISRGDESFINGSKMVHGREI